MLKAVHIDAIDAEADTFEMEASALFGRGGVGELDVAAGTDDAVPGELVGWVGAEQAGDGSVVKRVAGGGGDVAVGADSAEWNGEDDAAEGEVAWLVGPCGVAEEGAAGSRVRQWERGGMARWGQKRGS